MRRRNNINLARKLRKNANAPEQIAWDVLRKFRKLGIPVRRQHQIGNYIVDFAIVKESLVIEIDGSIHDLPEVAAKDAEREKELIDAGWKVLRVPAETAMSRDHFSALMQKTLGV